MSFEKDFPGLKGKRVSIDLDDDSQKGYVMVKADGNFDDVFIQLKDIQKHCKDNQRISEAIGNQMPACRCQRIDCLDCEDNVMLNKIFKELGL